MPDDDLPPELPEHLHRRLAELFSGHGVPPEAAEEILTHAAMEAWRRRHRGPTEEARFLRSIERQCHAYKAELRRRALQAADEPGGGVGGPKVTGDTPDEG